MTILALEFSSARRSVALARGGTLLAEAVAQTDGRGTGAFGLIEKVLGAANVAREEIEAIVVGLGPGSYTGIRAAIALAQGWQLAQGTKLLGVSSVQSLAAEARAQKIFGRIHLAVDAQRGEFYLSTWEVSGRTCMEISALKIVPASALEALKAAGDICLGPELDQTLFPSAAALARLAASRTDFLPGEALEPIYLRETSFVKAPARRTV